MTFNEWWEKHGRQPCKCGCCRTIAGEAWHTATERCAKIAESYYGKEPNMEYNHQLQKAGHNIAFAIREGK